MVRPQETTLLLLLGLKCRAAIRSGGGDTDLQSLRLIKEKYSRRPRQNPHTHTHSHHFTSSYCPHTQRRIVPHAQRPLYLGILGPTPFSASHCQGLLLRFLSSSSPSSTFLQKGKKAHWKTWTRSFSLPVSLSESAWSFQDTPPSTPEDWKCHSPHALSCLSAFWSFCRVLCLPRSVPYPIEVYSWEDLGDTLPTFGCGRVAALCFYHDTSYKRRWETVVKNKVSISQQTRGLSCLWHPGVGEAILEKWCHFTEPWFLLL